jgi:hypothetical protein
LPARPDAEFSRMKIRRVVDHSIDALVIAFQSSVITGSGSIVSASNVSSAAVSLGND